MSTKRYAVISLVLAGLVPLLARADDFYKGKSFTIVVGFSPGGGYDINARTLSRYISGHIPGNPTIVVQNMPSAGSLTSVRYLDVNAPKDGTVMTTFNAGLVTQSVVTPDKVQLDFRKYSWIGVITPDFRVCYGYGPKGVKSWDDMMHRKEFILGSTGRSSGNYINGATLREVFHAPVKQILGFPGSAEQRLAIERGELEGNCGSWSAMPQDWVVHDKINPLVRFARARPADMPQRVPFVEDLATTSEQRDLLAMLDASAELGRPLIVAKTVPPTRVNVLRMAFRATLDEPSFRTEALAQSMPLEPVAGEEAAAIINQIYSAPPELARRVKDVLE